MTTFIFSCFHANGNFAKEIYVSATSKDEAKLLLSDDKICPYPVAVFGTLQEINKK